MDPRGISLDHNLIDLVLWLILNPFSSLWTMPVIVIHEWPVVALFLALKIQMMNFATIFTSATNALILITIMKVRFARFFLEAQSDNGFKPRYWCCWSDGLHSQLWASYKINSMSGSSSFERRRVPTQHLPMRSSIHLPTFRQLQAMHPRGEFSSR